MEDTSRTHQTPGHSGVSLMHPIFQDIPFEKLCGLHREKAIKSFQEKTLTSAFTSVPTFYILSGAMILNMHYRI